MTPGEVITFLRAFNEWRRGDEDIPQPDPREIGEAIDSAIEALDEIERLRTQNAVLTDAIAAASALMASAPAWHQMHREAIAELQRVRKDMESYVFPSLAEPAAQAYCLGTGTMEKCKTCKHEDTWNKLNQLPNVLRLPLQGRMTRISDDTCRLTKAGHYAPIKKEMES